MKHSAIFFCLVVFQVILVRNSMCGQDVKSIDKFIKNNKISDFEILYNKDSVPCNLNVLCTGRLTSSRGKQIVIPGELISHYFSSEDVTITNTGRLRLNHSYLVRHDTAAISVTFLPGQPGSKTLHIPVNYRGNLVLDYSGKNGSDGKYGEKGSRGIISGRRSDEPGLGQQGQNGPDGSDGKTMIINIVPIVNTGVSSTGLALVVIKDYNNMPVDTVKLELGSSRLTLYVNGGNGGKGGNGGDGGDGSDGSTRMAASYGQFGALGGMGGNGGNGGNGGTVILNIEKSMASFQDKISVINHGGAGGPGGKGGEMGAKGVSYWRGTPRDDNRTIRNLNKDIPHVKGNDGVAGKNGNPVQIVIL